MDPLSIAQCIMLKSLRKAGWPAELILHCWLRAGGSQREFEALIEAGLVSRLAGRFILTTEGKGMLRRRGKAKNF